MTQTVSVDEAQNKLPDLLAQALADDEVIFAERGAPVARLVALRPLITIRGCAAWMCGSVSDLPKGCPFRCGLRPNIRA
jgi:prevent-host-death family protein